MTEYSKKRQNVARRLKRKGIITNIKGISTDELNRLWEQHKNGPNYGETVYTPPSSNFEQVKNILDALVADYDEYFIGWYRGARDYRDEIAFFWQRLDEDKINNDENFVPYAVNIVMIPPSDWIVGDEWHLAPEEIPDYLLKLYEKYLR